MNRPFNLTIDWNAVFNTMITFVVVVGMVRILSRIVMERPAFLLQTVHGEIKKLRFATAPIETDPATFAKWVETEKIRLLQAGGYYRRGRRPTLAVLDDKIYAVVRYGGNIRLLSARWEDVAEETLHEAEEGGIMLPQISLLPQPGRKGIAPYKVTVECPICQEVIEVSAISRTEALKEHIEKVHSDKRKMLRDLSESSGGISPSTRHVAVDFVANTKRAGRCYELAWRHVITMGEGTLVHGEVYSHKLGKMINHAWVETETGFIYEPVSERYFEKDWLYRTYQMKEVKRYTPDEARIWALKTKHYGPWEPWLLPQVLIEGGESVPPEYRHLVGWLRAPLPEYSLLTLPAVVPEEKERKIETVLKQLKDGVEGIQDSYQFRLFLTTMAKFHDYSIGNQILIMLQKPDATKVAGFNTWKDLGRWVNRSEKGIAILAPVMPLRPTCPECGARAPKGARFCPECSASVEEAEIETAPRYFKVVYVFDIAQTEGKPLPGFEVPVLTGEVNEELFANVMGLTKAQELEVSFESRPHQDPAVKGTYFGKSIWIRPEELRAQQLKSLLHEVAHYYSEGVFRIPRRDAETIAESAAFVVGTHYGFDTGVRSFPYVALWAQDKKVLEQNLDAIRRVAATMLEGLERT